VIGGRGRVLAAPALAAVVGVTLLVALPGAARAASDVQVTLLDCESHPRRIAIQNKGDTAQSLAGWKLMSDKPNEVFDLAVVGQVGAGETFYVFNGHLAPLAPLQLGGQWIYGWNPSEIYDPALFVLEPYATDFIRLVDASQFPWRQVSAVACESTTEIPPLQQPTTPTPSPSAPDQNAGGNTGTIDGSQPAATQTDVPQPAGASQNTSTGANTAASRGAGANAAQTGNVTGQVVGGPASGVGSLAGGGPPLAAQPLALGLSSLVAGVVLAVIGGLMLRLNLRRR